MHFTTNVVHLGGWRLGTRQGIVEGTLDGSMRVSEVGGAPGPDAGEAPLAATSRVLVIDDDAALAEMLSLALRSEGFDPIWCGHGDQAVDAYRDALPDLVLLDVMLPGTNGLTICQEIRAESPVPIVMLTVRTDTAGVVAGLEAGADDFIAKPFKAKELLARIRTRLRRPPPEATPTVLSIGDLVIDVDGHSVRRGQTLIQLTPWNSTCFALAHYPQQVFSRQMLLEQVWGYRRRSLRTARPRPRPKAARQNRD